MGTMRFQLPAELPRDVGPELEWTCMAGGPDNMPWPTEIQLLPGEMILRRAVDESGFLVAPWLIDGLGLLMGTSATLMERPAPYDFITELARGKINQVRCQAADWRTGGLHIAAPLEDEIHAASLAFGRAVTGAGDGTPGPLAQTALALGYQAAHGLAQAYVEQVFHIRHQRQIKLDTSLSCRLGWAGGEKPALPPAPLANELAGSFNAVAVPLSWHQVESAEGSYRWEPFDAQIEWALEQGLEVEAGPLIDFSSSQLPPWLWLFDRDVASLSAFMCKFVDTAVRRYRNRVRRWQVTAASNWASVLSLSEDELLGLTYRLGETARQVDSGLEIVVGIAQPWGEYMALSDRTYSPFIFADTLIRSGLSLAALDVEVVMGVTPRGSYCRDLLETSRMLDLYALLGVPLRVTLAYPSDSRPDAGADPETVVGAGRWNEGYTAAAQARWAESFAALALCKPFVRGLRWAHFLDSEPHQYPHCGLIDHGGQPKPALAALRALRDKHLRVVAQ